MKKKIIYWAAILVIGGMILAALLAIVVPRVQGAIVRSQTAPVREQLIGSWRAEAFNGNGSKWITFQEDGGCSLYQEVIAADGQSVHQSSGTYGSSTWELLSPTLLKITVSTIGYSTSEEIPFTLGEDQGLTIDGDTYYRQ